MSNCHVSTEARYCHLQFPHNALGQRLAQFDAPLVERIYIPDRPLRKDAVFIEGDQSTKVCGVRRSARRVLVGRLPSKLRCGHNQSGCSLGFYFIRGFAERQCLGLGEQIRHQQIVMVVQRIQSLAEANEVARDKARTLVYKLIKRVLTVGAGFAPDDR